MKQLQRIKYQILDYVQQHPTVRLDIIAERFDCSESWLKREMEKAGCQRGRGMTIGGLITKKRLRIQRLEKLVVEEKQKLAALEAGVCSTTTSA